MRFQTSALCAIVAAGLLAGCSGSGPSMNPAATGSGTPQTRQTRVHIAPQWSANASVLPAELRPLGRLPLHGQPNPTFSPVPGGIYVSEFYSTDIYAYQRGNTGNNPPTCTIGNVLFPNDIASDTRGDVIDPDGGSKTIQIFKGSGKCGSLIGTINDPYGQPVDASSQNAQNKTIAVANIFSTFQGGGTISLCTMKQGCTSNLTNPNMYEVIGVAMSRQGDCWATSYDHGGTAHLTYFQGCSGSGQSATGWANGYPGGLDIDKAGNIVSLDPYNSQVYVYSGCNPACSIVGGPFPLQGQAVYGHLNRQNMALATADFQYGQVDVYRYHTWQKLQNIKYLYSFNNGLNANDEVLGAAFAPRSDQ